MFDIAVQVISWVLMLSGSVFVVIGGIGALRMPDLYTRMHAASITDSLAPILIIGGLLLQSGFTLFSVKLVSILIFLLMSGPTASNALASAAMLSGYKTPEEERES